MPVKKLSLLILAVSLQVGFAGATHAAVTFDELLKQTMQLRAEETQLAKERVATFNADLAHQKAVGSPFGDILAGDQQVYTAALHWPLVQWEFIPRLAQGNALLESKRLALEAVSQRELHGTAASYYSVLKTQRLAKLDQLLVQFEMLRS